jgi:glycine betaine/choline ABC-type transport system substrate-binding protein
MVLLLASVMLVACGTSQEVNGSSQPQGASLRITLGTQVFPEARILGELWRQALAVNGYTVDLRKGVGPAEDLDALLQEGEIDGYVAYTGTVLSIVAGEDVTGLDPEETYEKAKAFYETRDMEMSAMTPFENKDAIATTSRFAQREQLRSIADLAELPSFTLAARPEFESLYLGLEGLEDLYGLSNAEFEPVSVGRQYQALENGTADAVDAFTTDPQLREGDYQVLEDPELLFGSQNVVMVVGSDELERVGKETFLEVVDTVNGLLSQDEMVSLNAAVTGGQDEEDVANAFLRQAGLLTPMGGEG